MFTAEHWLQPKLGVYIMNSCKTSQQGWFSGNVNMLKSGGKRKRVERKIIHSVLFGRKKWSVLAHWRITQNTSTLSCARRRVNAKKTSTTSRVTELRLKINYSRRKPIYRYTQIDSTLFLLAEKMWVACKKLLDTWSIHSYPYMLQQEASLKYSLSNLVKHVFVLTIPF